MVVYHDDAVCRIRDRWPEHFAWMHQTVAERADRDLVRRDLLILRVECDQRAAGQGGELSK